MRDLPVLGQTVHLFLLWVEHYGTFCDQGAETGHLASLGQNRFKITTFQKGLNRKSQANISRILGVQSVWTVCPAWGQTIRDLWHSGRTVQDFFVRRPISTGLFCAPDAENGHLTSLGQKRLKITAFKRSFNRKSQADIFKNSGCAVCLGRLARLGGKQYVTLCGQAR